jgi:hypothetical protein
VSDRELLEKAAKAAGIALQWPRDPSTRTLVEGLPPRRTDAWQNWNPLTDDGDALRLAVKLGIDLYARVGNGCTAIYHDFSARELAKDGDYSAATRRAIVRAAAAIGEAMP